MTKIITAILAVGCIMLGVGLAITSCPAMAAQPQQEWAQTVHKKPVAHKATPVPQAKPVEAPAPVVCPVLPPAPVATPEPPTAPSVIERNHALRVNRDAWLSWAWDWIKWPLGGLLIGGAITIIINAGRKVYAGFKAAKA